MAATQAPSSSLSPAVEPGASEVEESSVERQWLRHATAAEAEAAAAREGLPLIRSAANATGFLNVQYERKGRAGYIGIVPNVSDQRSHVHILCATPEAAALAVARHMGKEAAHAAAARSAKREELEDFVEMTADEAMAAAAAEGLPLIRSAASATGFFHVTYNGGFLKYTATRLDRCGSSDRVSVSCATPEGAALAVARHLGADAAWEAVAAEARSSAMRDEFKDVLEMTAEEAVAAAAEEGLPLVRANSVTGFRCVVLNHGYLRLLCRLSGFDVTGFTSREGAALAYSRRIGKEAATEAAARFALGESLGVGAALCMTAEEARATAAAEGLALVASDVAASGYTDVLHRTPGGAFTVGNLETGGKLFMWSFKTAEGAALVVARHRGAEGARRMAAERETKAKQAALKAEKEAARAAEAARRVEAARQRQAAKEAANAEAARRRQAAKEAEIEHRKQLEAHRARMAARQAELLREAAARQQRQRTGGAAPPPPQAAPSGLVLPDGPMDALVRQVLAEGGCSFRRLGLEPGAPPEAVRKRYLQLALRMHPDKASHARAQEAFTALEGAYSAAYAGLP